MPEEHEKRPCVILGSGFSRAISPLMPTMWELGSQVLDELHLRDDQLLPFSGNLEQWMSYLAVEQPWLTPAENYENRALFARVSEAVQSCIQRAEGLVMANLELPDWLLRLVATWCDQRAHIFSFNYDTLIERAVMQLNRIDTLGDVYAIPLEWRVAAGDGGRFGGDPPRDNVLALYKLHGSTNWAFGGIDAPPSDRVLLTGDFLRWQPTDDVDTLSPREQSMYDDVVPLIIPPTLTKGPYYTNLSLRGQWRRAAEALRATDRLTVIGYSFPAADLVASQWVSTTFCGTRMDVVDAAKNRPSLIRDQLSKAKSGSDVTGDLAVERYANKAGGQLVRWRIWDEHDGEGARVSLVVNGVEHVADKPLEDRPWGRDHDAAQRWLHPRIEKGEHNVINRAIGAQDGNGEDRWVVLRPGHRIRV
jgi:hypothetical protein